MTRSILQSDAPDRRQFLAAGAMLAAGVASAAPRSSASARSVIVLIDGGGASQLDSWDPKPSAPEEVRGPFGVTRTRVPGFLVGALFPRIATITDKMTVVRTLTSQGEPSHVPSTRMLREAVQKWLGPVVRSESMHYPTDTADRTRFGQSSIGQRLHNARVRVEVGDRLVVVGPSPNRYDAGWDAHTGTGMGVFPDFAAAYDRAYSTLITDLAERSLLDSTIVVGISEFGRAPQLNTEGGRHHWTGCWSATLAGGGFSTGDVIGRSDAWAAEPDDQALSVDDVLRTVATRLGRATTV